MVCHFAPFHWKQMEKINPHQFIFIQWCKRLDFLITFVKWCDLWLEVETRSFLAILSLLKYLSSFSLVIFTPVVFRNPLHMLYLRDKSQCLRKWEAWNLQKTLQINKNGNKFPSCASYWDCSSSLLFFISVKLGFLIVIRLLREVAQS